MKYPILFFSVLIFMMTSAYASKLYRHTLPFNAVMEKEDILIMDYDFSGKAGIRCTSLNTNYRIDFSYKGHQKFSSLPIILQNHHVPKKNEEELADTQGKFIITVNKNSEGLAEVSCQDI